MVLLLRNWIRGGVNKVRDLCFVDGKLDTDWMYDKIVHKGNIHTEILTGENVIDIIRSSKNMVIFLPLCIA